MRHPKKRSILGCIDNELSKTAQEEVMSHLASCPKCKKQERSILNERQAVKDHIDLILPATGFGIPPFVFPDKQEKIHTKPFPLRIIFTPVRIPAVAVAIIGMAFLGMFVLLLSKAVELSAARRSDVLETEQLTLICQDGITTFPIDVKLSGFRPIKDPRILVAGERGGQ